MKSIASAERCAAAIRPTPTSLSATGTDGEALQVAAVSRTAEEVWIAREDYAGRLAALEALFNDDEEAQMLIMADMDGLTGEAIRELTNWDDRKLATIRRRVRRRIDGLFPRGFSA